MAVSGDRTRQCQTLCKNRQSSSGTNLLKISSVFGLFAPFKHVVKQGAIVGFVGDIGQGGKPETVCTGRK